MSVSSSDILALLAAKHSEEVFIPECKDGPSYGTTVMRMDALAIKKSWANPCITGYEIKVSRGDFLRDDKWRGYLPCCNEFYFVAPAGIIKPDEVPPEAGMMEVAGTGTRLFRKKKAPFRNVEIPETLFRYILFSRVRVTRETRVDDKRAYWANWLKEQKLDRDFGWNVARRIQIRIEEEISKVRTENKAMADRMATYDDIREFLRGLGVDPDGRWLSKHDVRNRIDELREVVPRGLARTLEEGARALSVTLKMLAALEEKFKAEDGKSAPAP